MVVTFGVRRRMRGSKSLDEYTKIPPSNFILNKHGITAAIIVKKFTFCFVGVSRYTCQKDHMSPWPAIPARRRHQVMLDSQYITRAKDGITCLEHMRQNVGHGWKE